MTYLGAFRARRVRRRHSQKAAIWRGGANVVPNDSWRSYGTRDEHAEEDSSRRSEKFYWPVPGRPRGESARL